MIPTPDLNSLLLHMRRYGTINVRANSDGTWSASIDVDLNCGGTIFVHCFDEETPVNALTGLQSKLDDLAEKLTGESNPRH